MQMSMTPFHVYKLEHCRRDRMPFIMNGTLKNQYPPVLKDLNGTQRHNVGNLKKGSTLCKCTLSILNKSTVLFSTPLINIQVIHTK